MSKVDALARAWLDREDKIARHDRLERLQWLSRQMPPADLIAFPGGLVAKYLFEEARYSFTYGQFIGTVMLGLAYIERTLGALFYAGGRTDLQRASVARLFLEARNSGWLSEIEFAELEEIRTLRNPFAHFRRPLASGTIEVRAIEGNELPYSIIETDARNVLAAVLRILARNAA
jgi:hypothetical protein